MKNKKEDAGSRLSRVMSVGWSDHRRGDPRKPQWEDGEKKKTGKQLINNTKDQNTEKTT